MMKLHKIFSTALFASTLAFFAVSCEKNAPQPELTDNAKPVFTQMMDIDNDGTMELVIGFAKADVETLEDNDVILYGRLWSTNTRFETDPFKLDP
ncbi:MAG: hypothetical protein KDC85_16665 [Saprospiraceae bacterium]|nr:hypothetical protein [Saprospiraceae bacterium]MCB9323322.1 hypothetical protein [Lewinellaceae bacterium]